jgi:hypothetical protein
MLQNDYRQTCINCCDPAVKETRHHLLSMQALRREQCIGSDRKTQRFCSMAASRAVAAQN